MQVRQIVGSANVGGRERTDADLGTCARQPWSDNVGGRERTDADLGICARQPSIRILIYRFCIMRVARACADAREGFYWK